MNNPSDPETSSASSDMQTDYVVGQDNIKEILVPSVLIFITAYLLYQPLPRPSSSFSRYCFQNVQGALSNPSSPFRQERWTGIS